MKTIDPIKLEVIRHAFIAAAEEMKTNLMRTAYNPVIYEILDFSCGIFDNKCRMIAQADGLPIFLGNLAAAIKTVVQDIGLNNFKPGDLYLINDPYKTGTHVNDVTTVVPIFENKKSIIGFCSTRAHWLDIGSKDPGGSIDTTDVVQEGLWLRSVQLYDAGKLNKSIWRIIENNVRYQKNMMGDLRSQIASSRTGEKRLQDIFKQHGKKLTNLAIEKMIEQGEKRAKKAVKEMPNGVYRAKVSLDNDVVTNNPVVTNVKVTINDSNMIVDLTGSGQANKGPLNCCYPSALAACRIAFKCLTAPDVPVTEGDFYPLKLIAPKGSMYNVEYPSPMYMYGSILIMLVDAIIKALSKALPRKVIAGHYGNLAGVTIVGSDLETGEMYIHQEPEVGGWGASAQEDGENALIFHCDGDTKNIPAEVIESRFPLLLVRHELRQDSGGKGLFRGGLGIIRDYKVLGDNVFLTSMMDRKLCPPWGLFGGGEAQHCELTVKTKNKNYKKYMKKMRLPIEKDSVISITTGGGGGWGNSFKRNIESVKHDVVNGYISLQSAYKDYGVAISSKSSEVNQVETKKIRNKKIKS
jgi:N-methylhydantoinase B